MNRPLRPDIEPSTSPAGGYVHPDYAASLAEFGRPHRLPRSGSSILIRQVPGTGFHDAVGCYPLFACADWSALPLDLSDLQADLVSLSVVTDPFSDVNVDFLKSCFIDHVRPFKDHFVVDLQRPAEDVMSSHHRRNARQGARHVHVEYHADASALHDDWLQLYARLIQRHDIRGMTRFSPASFARLWHVPGLVTFRAVHNHETVGMTLWFIQENRAYYHLGAYSDAGYELKASFVLFRNAIDHFAAAGLDWLGLGAGAGVRNDGTDGLSRFKNGWATGTRTTYIGGRIFDPERYAELVKKTGVPQTNYFPAYRSGEFK